MLTIGSLFSGIGGLELGLEWSGIGPTLWQVEQNAFCRAVLEKHWPQAERFCDVRQVGAQNLRPVDLICGGFPCQDVSCAGTRQGLAGQRSGLWSEFSRVVSELVPEWVVVENVQGGAGRWLDAVVRELEKLGYAGLPVPVSARDVGAPHIRERMFIVAHTDGGFLRPESRARASEFGDASKAGNIADPDGQLCGPRQSSAREERSRGAIPGGDATNAHDPRRERPWTGEQVESWPRPAAHPGWASEPGVVPLVHGLSGGLSGRRRRARIRALGNAVVPQCAEVVGWVIRGLIEQEK